jgi:hypothetical protein
MIIAASTLVSIVILNRLRTAAMERIFARDFGLYQTSP